MHTSREELAHDLSSFSHLRSASLWLLFAAADKNRYTPLVANVPDSLGGPAASAAPTSSGAPASASDALSPASAESPPSTAAPAGTTSRDVGALYGYASALLNLCFLLQPTHVAACMDLGNRSSFRHIIFPDYKSERKPVEDALKWQLTQLARVTRALGIQPITAPGFEADDVIGTLARLASSPSASSSASASAATSAASPAFDRVIILSNDKDFIQCLNERVSILSPKTGAAASASLPSSSASVAAAGNGPAYVFLHHSEVPSVLGVSPSRFVEYLVLVGDVVDGIPGVAGVGPVRAKAILDAYPSLEACVEDCKSNGGKAMGGGKKPSKSASKVVESLLTSAPQLALWRELATIRTDVPDLPCAARTSAAAGADSTIAAAADTTPSSSSASSIWDHLQYHGPVAASSDEVEPITPEQQAVADSIHSVWREFSFPPPPHFVDEPSDVASAAAAAAAAAQTGAGGFDVPITSDPEPAATASSSSALPRLLSQAEWSELEAAVEARAKVKAARKKASASATTTAVFAAATGAATTTVEVVATSTQSAVSMQAKQR